MKPSGGYQLQVANKVLVARVYGVWNTTIAERYTRDVMRATQSLITTPWAHLVYLDDWQIGTADMEPIVISLVAWCIDNGLVRTAQILKPSALKEYQLKKMISEDYSTHSLRRFDDCNKGRLWLAQAGFMVPEQPVAEVIPFI